MDQYPPNKDDLKLLPLWARIAFSARCARYVQELFKAFWPNADSQYYKAIETLLTAAENAAKSAIKPECKSLMPLTAIIQHGMKLAEQIFQNEFKKKAITNSAWSALASFFAVTVINENQSQITDFTSVAVERSTLAAMNSIPLLANNLEEIGNIPSHFLGSKGKPILETIWTDYYRILKASKENNWTDETAVEPNFFDS